MQLSRSDDNIRSKIGGVFYLEVQIVFVRSSPLDLYKHILLLRIAACVNLVEKQA